VPTFADRDGAATISSKLLLSCTQEDEWTPFQTHYFSAGNRTRTSGSVARNSDHKTIEVVLKMHNQICKTESITLKFDFLWKYTLQIKFPKNSFNTDI
jgi:hypothetical protein